MSDPEQPGRPIGEVAKDVVAADPSNGKARPGKSSTAATFLKKPATLAAAGVVVAAGIAIGVASAVGGGGKGGLQQTTTTTQASPVLPAGSGSTSTSAVAVGPAPVLTPIKAVFDQSAFSTYYTETAQNVAGATYNWSVSITADPGCASGFKPGVPQPNEATWYHANVTEGGPCNHSGNDYLATVGHPGTVTLAVTTQHWRCTATYGGTLSGNGQTPASCTRS